MQKAETNSKRKSIFFIAAILIFALLVIGLYYGGNEIFKLYTNGIKSDKLITKDTKYEDITDKNLIEQPEESSAINLLHVNSLIPPAPTTNFDVNNYRNYLLNINLLVFNFLQDQNYNKQLQALEILLLPSEIQNILTDLKMYNSDYLIGKIDSKETIFPKNYLWLEKFIKIEKKSPTEKEKEKLHTAILEKLEFFINFFYSERFKEKFVK